MRLVKQFLLHGCDVALVETSRGARRAYYRPHNAWIRIRGYGWRSAGGKLVGQWQWHNATPVWGPGWSLTKGETFLWNACLGRATLPGTELELNTWLGRRADLTWHARSCQWLLLLDEAAAALPMRGATQRQHTRRRCDENA